MGNEAAERTEEATSRRRSKEREKGNVAKSKDMDSAMVMVAGIALLAVFSKYIYTTIKSMLQETFSNLNNVPYESPDLLSLMLPYFKYAAMILVPFLFFLSVAAIVCIRMNVGKVFSLQKVKLNLENLSPRRMFENAKRIFNPFQPRTMVEFAKSILKIAIVATCGYSAINSRKGDLIGLVGVETPVALQIIGSILVQMIINMCLAMLILGFLDKKYQTYEYEKSIKMTKQEIKDEHKDIEGDPKIKAKIRSIQMQMSRQRMMNAVPKADVVVTNPTHYAVAIQYDKEKAPAPIVVAKGVDYLAFEIKEIAKANNVPIVENRPVARALYNSVQINGIIPSDLYVAVAEILAYVYGKKERT